MSSSQIHPGPGNLVPFTERRKFLAATAIPKGTVVTFSGSTGYTITTGSNILPPIGVADEAIESGTWGDVVVHGFCDAVICTAANVPDKALLYAAAAGECTGQALGTDVSVLNGGEFGIALVAHTDLLIPAAWIYKNI